MPTGQLRLWGGSDVPKQKRQHYVPKFYLRRFAVDSGRKILSLFDIPSSTFVRRAKLKTQAYRDYFYGRDGIIEGALKDSEDAAARILKGVIRQKAVPPWGSEDYTALLAFAVVQRKRTAYAAEEYNELLDKGVKAVYRDDPRVKAILNHVRGKDKNPAAFALLFAATLAPVTFDLRCQLLVDKGDVPFITSDNPVVFYNQFLEGRGAPGSHTGLACKGLQVFFPVSPEICLLFYDADVYKLRYSKGRPLEVSEPGDILALNRLQYLNSRESVYFGNGVGEAYIRGIDRADRQRRREAKTHVTEYPGRTDPDGTTHSLVVSGTHDVRCELRLSFASVRLRAQRYRLGDRAVHLRDERVMQVREDFWTLVRQRRADPRGFHAYLRDMLPQRYGGTL